MSTRLFGILTSLCGILGVVMLITSFVINPGPPPDPTLAQFIAFGNEYHYFVLLGAWLQAVSAPILVLFALAIVHLADARTRFADSMTRFGGTILVVVSLIEITFYFSAVTGNPATTGLISLDLIRGVQYEYAIVAAPILFLPLGMVILSSRVLPHVFGYLALLLGIVFIISGFLYLFFPILSLITILSIIQGFWWLSAAITLLARSLKGLGSTVGPQREQLGASA